MPLPIGLITGNLTRRQKRMQNFQISQGELINPALMPIRTSIQNGMSIMEDLGMMNLHSKKVSSNAMAYELLGATGITITAERKNYSLARNQTDRETIANPNIMDSARYMELTPKLVTAIDKFLSAQDAFYTPDEPITRGIIQYKKSKNGASKTVSSGGDINKLAAFMIQRQTSGIPDKNKMKYFKPELVAKAKKRMDF